MTVPTTSNREQYSGNGVATVFAYNFKIFENSDLTVILTDTDNVDTTLILDTDYSVSGAGDANGNIIYPVSGSPLATGEKLTILREIPLTQETDLRNQGAWNPEVVEDEFDREVMISQQIQEELNRTPHFKETEDRSTNTNDIPSPEAGKALGWGVTGDLENIDFSIAEVTVPVPASAALLKAVDTTVSTLAYMLGKLTIGDSWQGWFDYYPSSVEVDDGENVITPNAASGRWIRQNNGKNSIYTGDGEGSVNSLTLTTVPLVNVTLDENRIFFVKNTVGPNTTNTPTLTINSLSVLNIKPSTGVSLSVGATGPIGYEMIFRVSGSDIILLNPSTSSAVGIGFESKQGLLTIPNSGTPLTILDISAGKVIDDTDSVLMTLPSAFTKSINSTFAVGSGNGGYSDAAPTIPVSGWTNVYIISKATDNTADIIFADTSANALADTVAAADGFVYARRIDSFATSSSQIIPWINGLLGEHIWDVVRTNYTGVDVPAGANVSVSAPPNQLANILYRVYAQELSGNVASGYGLITMTSQTDTVPSFTNSDVYAVIQATGSTNVEVGETISKTIQVDSSSEIRHREAGDAANVNIKTVSWTNVMSVL